MKNFNYVRSGTGMPRLLMDPTVVAIWHTRSHTTNAEPVKANIMHNFYESRNLAVNILVSATIRNE